jgi:myo-inositol-1(or 4)-monophosphatase
MEMEQGAEITWMIDPIDGTTNFVHQKINFCISVGIYRGQEGLIGIVYDPIRKEMFWAKKGEGAFLNHQPIRVATHPTLGESLIGTNQLWVRRTRKWGLEKQIQDIAMRSRGIRSLGAAALEMAYVAAGRLDAFLSLHLSPWDFSAGKLIVEEAGGRVSDFKGDQIKITKEKFGLLASQSHIHEEILHYLKEE